MDAYQQIAELTAELRCACLTPTERAAAIDQLHDLQRDIEIAEDAASECGDQTTAQRLFDQWSRIEQALTA
jgi:hypothetical protein